MLTVHYLLVQSRFLFTVITVQYFVPVYVMRETQSEERREGTVITENAANED